MTTTLRPAPTSPHQQQQELVDVVALAQQHTEADDLPAVVAVLAQPMACLDADTPTGPTVYAAALFASALAGVGHLGPALQWATWAHRTSQSAYPGTDSRAVPPMHALASVLAATGNTAQAVALHRDLVDLLTALDGATAARTLRARADLAVALHRRGTCSVAHATLHEAWTLWCAQHERRDPIAIRMCARLAIMYRDCGDPDPAATLFAQARHDATGSPVGGSVATAAGRPADPDHAAVCTHAPRPARIYQPATVPSHPPSSASHRHHPPAPPRPLHVPSTTLDRP